MKVVLEFTPEEFKANAGKTIDELFSPKAKTAPSKKQAEEVEEEEETEEDEETDEEETEEEEETEVDDDLIKTKISALSKKGKQASIKKVFAKYKCTTISGLKTKDYAAFYAELQKIK